MPTRRAERQTGAARLRFMNSSIVAFVIVLTLLTLSGALAAVRKRKTPEDYLVASRSIQPWLSALSTVATNNSGFMFIGMIGYTYRFGIDAIWLMFGWIIGDLIGWIFVHPRVRAESARMKVNTIPTLIGTRDGSTERSVIISAGIITVLFLGVYAAAQLKAGSTALHALFGWDMRVGALIGTAIVVLYSYAGGIRADIWTDAAQSFAMIGAMLLIMIAGYYDVGGPQALLANLAAQESQLVDWFPEDLAFGAAAFVLGYVFAGLGTIGQPHLMTRLISIESVEAIKRARIYYFLWYVTFFLAAIGVGLYCRAIIPDLQSLEIAQDVPEPTELALPLLTMRLLPDIFVGIALAGLFAATVSTADSQIIVCSGTATQEITSRWKDSYTASKLSTLAVTAMALTIALFAPEDVFALVLVAWSAMGAALGPVLLLRLFGLPLSNFTAIAMMIGALLTVFVWHVSGYDDDVLKILPGAAAAASIYAISIMLSRMRAKM
jgi:sodium/proline symporter